MSEKRKPIFTMLTRIPGKENVKIELFRATDFKQYRPWGSCAKRYRLRCDGKWVKNKNGSLIFLLGTILETYYGDQCHNHKDVKNAY